LLLRDDQEYDIRLGDCIPHMNEMPPNSVDFSVYSVPYPSTFSYTSLQEDIGNSEDLAGEAKLHFQWFFRSIFRVTKPGRVTMVHCSQIHRQKRSGESGVFDFRGLLIRLAVRAGFIYDYDWVIRRAPQAQAIRTRKWELKFQGLETDSTVSRGAMPDYAIKFRKSGDNVVPVKAEGNVTRNQWIDWAECCWSDIKETNTLNVKEGRAEEDTKHIAALQLDLIERLIRLYSNPGEIVFSPFAGIGSELYTALKLGRRAYGVELKDEYHKTAIKNCERAIRQREAKTTMPLFDAILEEAS
jgi:DNA modification methylase